MTTQHAKSNAREGDGVADHVALLTRLRDDDREYLADRPDGDPRWRAAKSARIEALTAAIAALQAQQGAEPVAWIPILGTPFAIHRELLNEEQAKRNHYQTLDQLAERGGLSPSEAHAIWRRRPWESINQVQVFADFIAATGAPR